MAAKLLLNCLLTRLKFACIRHNQVFRPIRPYSSKVLEVVVSSLRIDRVLATGLGIGRGKAELRLLAGNVFINRERVAKKSRFVSKGDVIDMLEHFDGKEEMINAGRVIVNNIGEQTSKGKYWIQLERWKNIKVALIDYK